MEGGETENNENSENVENFEIMLSEVCKWFMYFENVIN